MSPIDPRLEKLLRSASLGGICPWCGYGPLAGHDPECDIQQGRVVIREPIDPATLPPLPKLKVGDRHWAKIKNGMKR